MNMRNNRRAQYTRQQIREVFISLLAEKPVEKITVQELCKQVEINRSTFYAHYTDVHELLESILQEHNEQLRNIFYDENNTSGWELPRRCFESMFDYFYENQDFYRAYLKNAPTSNVVNFRSFLSFDKQLIPLLRRAGIQSPKEGKYRYEYFHGGLNSIVREWINSGCQEKPQLLAEFLHKEFGMKTAAKNI
ncbi:MAG: TetR/AcrR family transcriptional regulator C-terminal domain-containing protein [Eubacteriales bacterium]|jgi:AcrR family transcriptional regulator|nr:TetR/AcrR family transcriptional regulator C-terminal domain-containing protein [Eubacteriales bacterium]MDD3197886.1 TetR/AcrR family transcriptional regulator C-terminal domain-containing protein [Eubacteriales bacterium]MDD4683036.1 TetR/AcrR family transcriptional regulator C-terminal domain-containing protein [Eubacteriales bacterium]